jgi:hypothetical protein
MLTTNTLAGRSVVRTSERILAPAPGRTKGRPITGTALPLPAADGQIR